MGTVLRRGHDISCPYKEKQEPGFPVGASGTPGRSASRKTVRDAPTHSVGVNAKRETPNALRKDGPHPKASRKLLLTVKLTVNRDVVSSPFLLLIV